ncbi:protein of unknown function [Mesotoga infera]|uniref:Uncharacterized protein n=1 Tax=Mesotoga infera TaxID=1236046 RepID=A0A7Z7LEH7_9BACT|nr:protein of unknown function [Mesotoga infera]
MLSSQSLSTRDLSYARVDYISRFLQENSLEFKYIANSFGFKASLSDFKSFQYLWCCSKLRIWYIILVTTTVFFFNKKLRH